MGIMPAQRSTILVARCYCVKQGVTYVLHVVVRPCCVVTGAGSNGLPSHRLWKGRRRRLLDISFIGSIH
jgi:hypothetical protein